MSTHHIDLEPPKVNFRFDKYFLEELDSFSNDIPGSPLKYDSASNTWTVFLPTSNILRWRDATEPGRCVLARHGDFIGVDRCPRKAFNNLAEHAPPHFLDAQFAIVANLPSGVRQFKNGGKRPYYVPVICPDHLEWLTAYEGAWKRGSGDTTYILRLPEPMPIVPGPEYAHPMSVEAGNLHSLATFVNECRQDQRLLSLQHVIREDSRTQEKIEQQEAERQSRYARRRIA